jgi:DNA-binding LytR/AlgR family response regulator
MKPSIYHFEAVRNNYLILFKNRVKIHLSEIILLEAELNYTHLYLQSGKKITIARTLKAFEKALDCYHFHRIHRAFLINGEHLKSYNLTIGEALMTNDYRVIASRRKKMAFEGQINRAF